MQGAPGCAVTNGESRNDRERSPDIIVTCDESDLAPGTPFNR